MTMILVVSRSRLKAPPGTSSPCISTLTPSGQSNCTSWASQPQKSVTLLPQPGGGDHESSYEHVVALGREKSNFSYTTCKPPEDGVRISKHVGVIIILILYNL